MVQGPADSQELDPEDQATLNKVCHALEAATGCRLEHAPQPINDSANLTLSAPANPGVGASPGHFRILFDRPASAPRGKGGNREATERLAAAIAELWQEMAGTRRALRDREAELAAAGVAFVSHASEPERLAERLEAALRFAAENVGCQAAALYLLDPATTELKLRSSWGLPEGRFTERARPLRGAAADLEALIGHAVVLSDDQLWDLWKAPEQFAAGVCVPISTPTMPLGTLWFFSRHARDFGERETGLLEIVAGRVASDLERELLLAQLTLERDQHRQVEALNDLCHQQCPSSAPLVDAWQIAARRSDNDVPCGSFYDWFAGSDGATILAAGQACRGGLEGAMTAAATRAALRATALANSPVDSLLANVNTVLWTGSAGGQSMGLACAAIEPTTGSLTLATSGQVAALVVGTNGYRLLGAPSAPLGASEACEALLQAHDVRAGEAIVVVAGEALSAADDGQRESLLAEIASAVGKQLGGSAEAMLACASHALDRFAESRNSERVVLVLKRR